MEDKKQILELLDQAIAGMQCTLAALEGLKLVVMDGKADAEEVKPEPVEEAVTEAPKAEEKGYSFIDVRKALAAKSHQGFTEQVKALIAKFGAVKLSDVKETDYSALMKELEGIR